MILGKYNVEFMFNIEKLAYKALAAGVFATGICATILSIKSQNQNFNHQDKGISSQLESYVDEDFIDENNESLVNAYKIASGDDGMLSPGEYENLVRDLGFSDVKLIHNHDYRLSIVTNPQRAFVRLEDRTSKEKYERPALNVLEYLISHGK